MTKRLFIAGLICLLLAGMSIVTAQEATPEPPIENECSPGGVLYREENQDGCPTEWHWKAGWYLAQYNNGELSREDFPDEFAETLPPPIEVPPPSPPVITDDDDGILTICHYNAGTASDHCLKADKTGTVISTIPEVPTLFFYLLIPSTETCPPMYGDHGLRGQGGIDAFIFVGFSLEELAMLGMDETYWNCEYNLLGNW